MLDDNKDKRFTLRLDLELFNKVKKIAEENKRSTAKQIEYILEKCLNQNK